MCAFCAAHRDGPTGSARGSATAQHLPAPHSVLHLNLARDLHGPSSSSQRPPSQLEQRVGTLETLAQRLQQSLSQALQENIDLSEAVGRLQTLVENVQQELGQALQRVEELEATVENWQQEQWQENWHWEEWQLTGGSPSCPSSHQ